MTDLEDLLRETFRERGHDVSIAPAYTVPSASRRPSGPASAVRRFWRPLLAATAVAGVITVVAVAVDEPPSPAPSEPVQPVALVGDVSPAPPGQQAVSSRGLEILVPEDWLINDFHCGQSAAPTVVRGHAVGLGDCYTPEPAEKTVAMIGGADLAWYPIPLTDDRTAPPIELRAVTVDGRPAERGQAVLADGRTAGLLRFTDDDVAVAVRAIDPATVATVLDSARRVGLDSAGCPAERPDALAALAGSTDDPLAELDEVQTASVCSYPLVDATVRRPFTEAGEAEHRLGSSIVVEGEALERLVAAIDGLSFGARPDLSCADPRPAPEEEAVIALRLGDGSVRYVVVAAYGCGRVVFAPTQPTFAREGSQLWEALARTVYQGVTYQLADPAP